jgi:hypothetical protein
MIKEGKQICAAFFHTSFVLLHDHYVQKKSGTGMATVGLLSTVSA